MLCAPQHRRSGTAGGPAASLLSGWIIRALLTSGILLAAGCGSGDEVVSGPGGSFADTQAEDASLKDATKPDSGGGADAVVQDSGPSDTSAPADGVATDAADTAAGDVAGCPGAAGCACKAAGDCDSGVCKNNTCIAKDCVPEDETCDGADQDCDGLTDEDTCDDDEPCTADTCKDGKCANTNTTAPCDADGDACTADACKDGKCAAGDAKSCDDGNPCTNDTCDAKSGACSHGAVADGQSCDDDNACTSKDQCAKGTCQGQTGDCDDKNPCTKDTCDPTKGCVNTPAAGSCDDGDQCTEGDACDAKTGACTAGKAKSCDDSNPCTDDSCDSASGTCLNAAKTGACDDGSLCTEGDTCAGGTCAGKAKSCDDKNPCTGDACQPTKGCVFTPIGAPCDDGNACTDFDVCDAGSCKGKAKDAGLCDDNNPCTADSCAAASGCVNLPTTATCTDGDACTTDACQGGKCVNVAWVCGCKDDKECAAKDDDNLCNGKLYCDKSSGVGVCKVDPKSVVSCDTSSDGACQTTACEPKTGACKAAAQNEGKPCDADGSICTAGDACKAGACVAGKAAVCDDNNPCTTDSCDPQTGCAYLPNAATCDADGNACTVGDGCKDKLCTKGAKKDCDDDNPCTTDSCDPKTGACVHEGKALDGQGCDADGSFCTANDACSGGKCVPGKALSCDDNNPCTTDSCQPKTGCVQVANAASCDADGDPCTENDTCSGKACKAGPKKSCDDGKKCTDDACEAKTGKCLHTVIVGCGDYCEIDAHCDDGNPCTTDACKGSKCAWTPKTGTCDDGNACTVADGCDKGVCAGLKKPCDDGNPCTNDGCQPASGCVHLNNAAPCDDFDSCTQGDKCAAGKCTSGVKKNCDDGDKCTNDSCIPATGACVSKGIPGCGGYCNNVTDCNDNNPCTDESCDQGKCSSKVNTKACDDGSQCTTGDACKDGKCIPGKAKVCDDGDPCTLDGCDPKTAACTVTPAKEGAACDDGNPCTDKDACAVSGGKGVCKGGPKSCDDANACTADSCEAKTGKCLHVAKSGPCEDGDKCTAGDTCDKGACVSGAGIAVQTLAGAKAGFADGKGSKALMHYPYGVAVGAGGAVVVADAYNHRIRTIAEDGTTKTLAGSGKAGLLDGKGAAAWFNRPFGVDVDAKGRVLVADRDNHAIRAIAADGTVSTLAGMGTLGTTNGAAKSARFRHPYDVAASGDGSVVYVADTYNHRIRKIAGGQVSTLAGGAYGFVNAKGTAARFRYPIGVAVDPAGNVIVGDQSNHRIRRVTPAGVVTTVAGSGSAGFLNGGAASARFYNPWGVAVDAAGVIYVGDRYTHRIRRIEAGVVTTWAGGSAGYVDGKNTSARFLYPAAVAVSPQGVVVVGDGNNHRVRRVVDSRKPCAIDGACWVEGAANPKSPCLRCDPGAAKEKWSSAQDGASCDDGALCTTGDACKAGQCAGQKVVCDDKDKCTLDACDAGTGACAHTPIVGCGGNCAKDGDCDDKNPCTTDACTSGKCAFTPHTKACDDGNVCTWGDTCAQGKCVPGARTEVTTLAGSSAGSVDGKGTKAKLYYPRGMEAHPKGGFVITSANNDRVRRVLADGTVTTIAGGTQGYVDGKGAAARFYNPSDVAILADGTIYVADLSNHRIRKIDTSGAVTTLAGSSAGFANGKGAAARFYNPYGIAASKGGVLYVSDHSNNRIRRVTTDGVVTTLAGGAAGYVNGAGHVARFRNPIGLSVAANGDVIVADYGNSRIRRVTPDGVVSLLAGSGSHGYLDGPAAQARFNRPWDVVSLPDGRVLVADRYNHRLRSISASGLVTRLAGTGSASYTDGDALTQARFREPWGLAVDPLGQVFVADYYNHRVRKVRITAGVCSIGKACYAAGVREPGKACSACDAAKSVTSWSAAADGATCDDGAYCTQTDVCASGACKGKAKACDDNNKCSADSCDPKTGGCAHKAIQGCDGWCQVNADCEDGNPCVTDTCVGAQPGKPGTCKHDNNLLACDDGNSCTEGDKCKDGKCLAGTATWVTTLAGTSGGYVEGDSSKAKFNQPHGVNVAADGAVWLADRYNHRIRKVSGGKVSLVAGSKAGYANGPALAARFNDPVDVAFGAGGVTYVCDRGNHRIRAIDAKGVVSTLAGSNAGYANGKGANARFYNPYGIATNSAGTLYVADYSNHRVRRVSADGTVTTLAGSSAGYVNGVGAAARLHTPIHVAALADGRVVVVEHGGHRLRLITPEGATSLLAGAGKIGLVEGKGSAARFNYPRAVAWSGAGYLVVADQNNHRLRKVTLDGTVSTFAGSGAGSTNGDAVGARFNSPRGVAVAPNGTVYVGDAGNHRVRAARPTALPCSIGGVCWANGTSGAACKVCDGAKAPKAWTDVAAGGACDDGALCTAADACAGGKCAGKAKGCDDKDKCTADSCDTSTGACQHKKIIGCDGYCETDAHCDDGNPCTLGATCTNNSCKQGPTTFADTLAGGGKGYADGPAKNAKFNNARGLSVDGQGRVWVADLSNHRIRRIAKDGTVSTVAGSGKAGLVNGTGTAAWFNGPSDLAVDATGTAWVADRYTHSLRVIDLQGKVTTLAGNGAAGYNDDFGSAARFNQPAGIARAPGGMLYVADTYNHRIRRVEPDGTVHTYSGIGIGYADGDVAKARFRYPIGVALGADGMLFVADYGNHRIRKVTPDGTATTVAGSGKAGLLDGAVANAQFYYPWGIAVDSGQRIYVTDRNGHRVRLISGGIVQRLIGLSAGFVEGHSGVARFSYPSALVVSPEGTLFVGDDNNGRVRRVRQTKDACHIGGVCWTAGVRQPGKPCLSCAKGAKSWAGVADGAVCDDGSACTVADTCKSGSCTAGQGKLCDDNNKCTTDSCNKSTGACEYKPNFDPNCKP